MKIGLTYLKGSVPGFENFGNLPTDIVKFNGLVNGIKAHKELDAIIIPGGTIVESESVTPELATEIKKIASDGKLVLGICSGFQALSNQTDTGRNSPCPIIKKGLGLLDVDFSPLISNDRVEATIVNDSFLTKNINEPITGFHCHTYGHIEGNETPILYSNVKRMNYVDTSKNIQSGVVNNEGNVFGVMIHNILDENPQILDNIFNFLDADPIAIDHIFEANELFKKNIRNELAIDSNINIKHSKYCDYFKRTLKMDSSNGIPPTLMIGSTGSDSGKTFITTGIVGALTKKGLNVAILKIGPDIRDTVPSLYLTKGKMEDFASIKIGHLGWMDIKNVLKRLKTANYDFILIEGVMSVFTGLLNEKIPYSGAEIAISSNIPILLVSGVNKGGIESTAIDLISHSKMLQKMGISINGIILNKVYDDNIFNEVATFIRDETNVSEVLAIPKVKLDKRSTTPEVEIKLEDFSLAAVDTIEKYLDLEKIATMSAIPEFKGYLSYKDIKAIFKKKTHS